MKRLFVFAFLAHFSLSNCAVASTGDPDSLAGHYTLVVEGFDWGAAASKVILAMNDTVSHALGSDFEVMVDRSTDCAELAPDEVSGPLTVQYAYVSDAHANRVGKGTFVTLVLFAAPFESLNAPVKYFSRNPRCSGNHWIDFNLTIEHTATHQLWNKEVHRSIPLVDDFDISGQFTHEDITLTYAAFAPADIEDKHPLLIWLHGGGEGGTDPTIPLIANRAANYAAPDMQAYFDGAYVLVPQSPTFWMDNGQGEYTRGEVNDMYNESLMALIKNYVAQHPNIDPDRIYVGGCSNGGYMTLKLLLQHPDYFAAAFPSALAYHASNITEQDIERIKHIPIWFIHSKDDPVTVADETVVPVYRMLKKSGAKHVHFSYFDHVVDITNQFGGDQYHHQGHSSWIYSHANKCQLDYDGTPVRIDGQPVTLMGWMSRQRRAE